MAVDYIPSRINDQIQWATNFSTRLTDDPALYQISPAQAADIAAAVLEFTDAQDLASSPYSRTPANILARKLAQQGCIALCRTYAMQIRQNAGVSDEAKEALGINPINNTRSPINVPTTSPELGVFAGTYGAITVKYRDSTTPSTGARPFGAASLLLTMNIGDEPDADWTKAVPVGNYSRNPIGISFLPEQDGKVVTLFGRWVSPRGQLGPISLPVSYRIAA